MEWRMGCSAYLGNPVRVQDAEVAAATASTLLSDGTEGPLELEGVDTLGGGLTVDATLPDLPLTATTADAHSVDDEALLGLVAETAGLVGAAGPADAQNHGVLPVLPAPEPGEEAHHVGLLLPPEFLDILVGA